jgi:hypothetical protein
MLLRLVPVTLTRIPLAPDIAWGTPDAAAVAPVTTVPWRVAPVGLDPVGELVIALEPHPAAAIPRETANKK